MQKKILIIGGGPLQVPAIITAKECGLFVGVIDLNQNAPGAALSDVFYNVSTNDIDSVINVSDTFLPDGVLTIATDMPVRSVAAVAAKHNLNSISSEVAEKATDKIKMIECFQKFGVPHPWFYIIKNKEDIKNIISTLNVPFIIKPNDCSGSRGVVLVNNINDVYSAYDYCLSYSKSKLVLFEEYLIGPEVSVEFFRINGESYVIAITDKLTTGAPHFVEMGHSQPSQLSQDIQKKIKEVAIKAAEAIGIDNSPAHIEIIVTKDGPKLVELGARLGGDCITTHLVKYSTGIDMVKASIDLALGEVPNINPSLNKGSAIRYISAGFGTIINIEGIDCLTSYKNIKDYKITKCIGDKSGPIESSNDRIGYVISQAGNSKKAIEICNNALSNIKVITTNS